MKKNEKKVKKTVKTKKEKAASFNFKSIQNWIQKNRNLLILLFVSLLCLIFGILTMGILPSILLIGVLDGIAYLALFHKPKKGKSKGKHRVLKCVLITCFSLGIICLISAA